MLAVIPARGGSKGVARKNVAILRGLPLIGYTINAALAASSVDKIYVSTEDEEIASISLSFGAEVIYRPKELATDSATTLSVLQHAVAELSKIRYYPTVVMTLQPTSPLRTSKHIDEAAGIFMNDETADSLVSCIEVPHIYHPESVMRQGLGGYLTPYLEKIQPTRRQDKVPVLARNGAAIYITRTANLKEYIFGGRLLAYKMSEDTSLDIDTAADLIEAEKLLVKQMESNQ